MTRSLVGPSFGAFIAEQSAEENRARVFGISETIFMVVAVIGPPLGGWLADTYGFKLMLLCAASCIRRHHHPGGDGARRRQGEGSAPAEADPR